MRRAHLTISPSQPGVPLLLALACLAAPPASAQSVPLSYECLDAYHRIVTAVKAGDRSLPTAVLNWSVGYEKLRRNADACPPMPAEVAALLTQPLANPAPMDPVFYFDKGMAAYLAKDMAKARENFGKSCEGGAMTGCRNYGQLLMLDSAGPTDLPGARGAYGRACDLGEAASCDRASMMQERGMGGPADTAAAQASKARACQLDKKLCG